MRAFALSAALLLSACDSSPAAVPPSAALGEAPTPPANYPASGTLDAKMASLAARYATNLLPASALMRGTLTEGAAQEHVAMFAAGVCHKVLGVGGDGVRDLDLILHDPNAVVVQRDVGQDAIPIVGNGSVICPPAPGLYRIEVRMAGGAGEYGVQVYQSRP